ncbi:unnamed protein product [Nezara viridula]|uniref:Uncharacterized protein n=1 Tax=Nezara viridula TaxID=85310 RepID=A0A9P0EEP5_NEZVI|nr:unnamed protein product [Nezara viridula]
MAGQTITTSLKKIGVDRGKVLFGRYTNAGFRSSSQGQVSSAVAAKEHSRVHLCLGLVLRKLNPLDYRHWSELERTDGMPQSIP